MLDKDYSVISFFSCKIFSYTNHPAKKFSLILFYKGNFCDRSIYMYSLSCTACFQHPPLRKNTERTLEILLGRVSNNGFVVHCHYSVPVGRNCCLPTHQLLPDRHCSYSFIYMVVSNNTLHLLFTAASQ